MISGPSQRDYLSRLLRGRTDQSFCPDNKSQKEKDTATNICLSTSAILPIPETLPGYGAQTVSRNVVRLKYFYSFCCDDDAVKDHLEALVEEMLKHGIRLDDAMEDFETRFIQIALARTSGNQCKAAELLHIHRNTLARKILQHRLHSAPKLATRRKPPSLRSL
jgi:DNA-binding NtrC family response regulator